MSLDYCTVGRTGGEQLEVLVARDGVSKALFAHVVHRRGGGGEGVVRSGGGPRPSGYKRVLLQGDHEKAARELRSEVGTASA